MTPWIPTEFALVHGRAEGATELNAFDSALANAGVQHVNLLKVSSIVPRTARRVDQVKLTEGALVPAAYATVSSSVAGELISAAVGVVRSKGGVGIVMEYAHVGPRSEAESVVSRMLAEAISVRGLTIESTEIAACEHKVRQLGCCFAGVVFSPVPST